jgi:hypothetical protein
MNKKRNQSSIKKDVAAKIKTFSNYKNNMYVSAGAGVTPCEACQRAIAGFDGSSEPPFHPNCKCRLKG